MGRKCVDFVEAVGLAAAQEYSRRSVTDSLRQASTGYKSAGKVGWPLGAERLLYPRIVLCNMFT